MSKEIKRRPFLASISSLSGFVAFGSFLRTSDPEQRLSAANIPEAKEVPWLEEVSSPPLSIPADAPRPPSLLDPSLPRESAIQAWRGQRERLLTEWIDLLGVDPKAQRPAVEWRLLDKQVAHGLVRSKIQYEPHPGWKVEAYLLRPIETNQKHPAALVLHPTVNHSIDEPVGILSKDGPPDGPRALGLHLAKKGFVVLVPRNYLWPENHRIAAKEQAMRWTEEQERLAKSFHRKPIIGMGKMLYDTLVGFDILERLPEVDGNRMSVLGHSLGAKEALYSLAFDSRVKVAAASEGGIGIRFSNWEAEWYLGKSIQDRSFRREHHELLALAAPKPFLNVAGESADGDRGWPIIERGREVYSLFDPPIRLGQYNHRTGHPMTEEASRRMVEWIATYT